MGGASSVVSANVAVDGVVLKRKASSIINSLVGVDGDVSKRVCYEGVGECASQGLSMLDDPPSCIGDAETQGMPASMDAIPVVRTSGYMFVFHTFFASFIFVCCLVRVPDFSICYCRRCSGYKHNCSTQKKNQQQ